MEGLAAAAKVLPMARQRSGAVRPGGGSAAGGWQYGHVRDRRGLTRGALGCGMTARSSSLTVCPLRVSHLQTTQLTNVKL